MDISALKQHIDAVRLDETNLQKVEEQYRLCKVELNTIEQEIEKLCQKQERLRIYLDSKAKLDDSRQQLTALNKEFASQQQQRDLLHRYESFEIQNTNFQRLKLTEENILRLQKQLHSYQQLLDEETALTKGLEENWMQADKEREIAFHNMLEQVESISGDIQQSIAEITSQKTAIEQKLITLNAELAPLLSHQTMLQRAEPILLQLNQLSYMFQRQESLQQQVEQNLEQQQYRNNVLGEIYTQQQNIKAEIEKLQAEVEAHQQQIAGQNHYNLQQHALILQNRKTLFETALRFWENIARDYDTIEETDDSIHSLQVELERCARDITLWKEEMGRMDVQLVEEISMKQHAIAQQEQQIATLRGKLEVEEKHLATLLNRQRKNEQNWMMFSALDKAIEGCSAGIDRPQRTLTLQTLHEQTSRIAEEAQQELNEYSYYLNAINDTNDRIKLLRREEADLMVRINEENTAYQVLSQQVETSKSRLKLVTREFTKLYNVLQEEISLPNWFDSWQKEPESIRLYIQQMQKQWIALNTEVSNLQQQQRNFESEEAALSKEWQHLQALEAFQQHDARVRQLAHDFQDQKDKTQTIAATCNVLQQQMEALHQEERDMHTEIDLWMHQYNANHPPVCYEELHETLTSNNDWDKMRTDIQQLEIQRIRLHHEVDLLTSQIVSLQIEGGGTKDILDSESLPEQIEGQLSMLHRHRDEILLHIGQLGNTLESQQRLKELYEQ